MKPVGFGILGCAGIARAALAPAVLKSKNARLVAVGSSRPEAAEEFAHEFQIPHAYSSYSEVLANPEVDAVYIPSTGDRHHPMTLEAAKAGKHVLCEKALAVSYNQAREMVEACEKAGVLLQEGFMWRHNPRSLDVRKRIRGGEIGQLLLVCAHFSFDIDRTNWRVNPGKGGGAVWDLGCYGVNACRFFIGEEPDTIHGRAHFNDPGADMTMQIALAFPGGALANVDCSFELAHRCEVELVGTKGRFVLPLAFGPPEEAELFIYSGSGRLEEYEIYKYPPANQFVEQVDNFCRSMEEGRLIEPAENGLDNMKVLDEALQQSRGAAGLT